MTTALLTNPALIASLKSAVANGDAWIDGKVSINGCWPEEPHAYIITDSRSGGHVSHVEVSVWDATK